MQMICPVTMVVFLLLQCQDVESILVHSGRFSGFRRPNIGVTPCKMYLSINHIL